MPVVHVILLVFAFVLAALASFGVNHPKLIFGWAALALFLLDLVINGVSTFKGA